MTRNVRGLFFLILCTAVALASVTAQIDLDGARAQEEFRFGVLSFHAGRFSDAIVAFTRGLAFSPEDDLIREWLGRAYYQGGFEDAALNEWDLVASVGSAGPHVRAMTEMIEYRRGLRPFIDPELELNASEILPAVIGETRFFQRPAGVDSDPYGLIYVVSLATQEVMAIDPNGGIRQRYAGGLAGLDQPMDVAWTPRGIYVTEFGGDRITLLNDRGLREMSFGESGIGDGQLLGPQFIAVDDDGFVYVTDWGNRRAVKFAADGTYLFSFGGSADRALPPLGQLVRPTGVAVGDGIVYIADRDSAGTALKLYDDAGNYLSRIPLPLDSEDAPSYALSGAVVEDIAWYDEDHLAISVADRVLIFDPAQERQITAVTDEGRRRIVSAGTDANGRLVVTDFDADEIGIFEPTHQLYGGIEVRIERIVNRGFPQVAALVSVHDRDGNPVIGLDSSNFVVSERGRIQAEASADIAVSLVEDPDVGVLLAPRAGDLYAEDAEQAILDLVTVLGSESIDALYLADETPLVLLDSPASAERFAEAGRLALQTDVRSVATATTRLEQTIRLATGNLLARGLRRELVLIGDGRVGDLDFAEGGVQDLAAYLRNNGVRFHLVLLEQRSPDDEISFLVSETDGTLRYLYEPQGLTPLPDEFASHPSGRYWLSYEADADSDFGRAYIELSVEVGLFVRSGRDRSGFFGPAPQ